LTKRLPHAVVLNNMKAMVGHRHEGCIDQPRRTGRTQIDEPPLSGSEARNSSTARKEKERQLN
jgi:hypothetical protein